MNDRRAAASVIGLAIGLMCWSLVVAACGSNDNGATPSPTPSPSPTLAATELMASVDDWQNAASVDSCEIDTPRVTVRDDVSQAVSIGPVYLITGTSLSVDLEHPLQKVLILVDDSAGSFVSLHGERTGDRIPLLFYYRFDGQLGIFDDTSNLKQDALGVDELDLTGPFHLPIDAGRGFFLATHPGCYDVTAEWEGGTATRQFYFYLDAPT